MGMKDVTLGYAIDNAAMTEGIKVMLEHYVSDLGQLTGAQPETPGNSNAYQFDLHIMIERCSAIADIFRHLVRDLCTNGA